MNLRTLVLAATWGACALAAPGVAHETSRPSPFDQKAAIAYSQAAIGRKVGDYAFRDTAGKSVRLSDFRGKPLIVNLVYTGCRQSCPVVVQSLSKGVAVAQDALGADSFRVITIGFDTDVDTPRQMRAYARSQGVDLPNWQFLSTDEDTVEALSRDVGFIFYPSPKGFDHLAQTTILDGSGVVYRQVYGAAFKPPAVVDPLKNLVFGANSDVASVTGIINQVRLFCTLYDPKTGRYRFDYSMFIGLGIGMASLSGVSFVLARALWRRRRGGA